MEPSPAAETFTGSIGDELDRLDVLASKAGSLSSEQAFSLLTRLDSVYAAIQGLDENLQSRMLAETQLHDIMAVLRRDAARFLRDMGGARALQQAREQAHPSAEHEWWFLDEFLAQQHRTSLRRILITGGIAVVALVVLAVLYQRFLAPDPQVAARYQHDQSARDLMMNGDLANALREVDQGLQAAPGDPSLTVLKGVILEQQGQTEQAAKEFTAAQAGLPTRADFLLTRGQAYLLISRYDKALADGQEAVRLKPQSAEGYLLLGQAHELLNLPADALDDYNLAFDAASKNNQPQLAAISRTRLAMLMQTMNTQYTPSTLLTPTPSASPKK